MCVLKTTPLLLPGELAPLAYAGTTRASWPKPSASGTPICQGQLVVVQMQVIRFSGSFLKSYFYTHHPFRKKIKKASREAAMSCREPVRQNRDWVSAGLFPWVTLGTPRVTQGAWASSSSQSQQGYMSTILHRIRTPRDGEITRKDKKIFTHHCENTQCQASRRYP